MTDRQKPAASHADGQHLGGEKCWKCGQPRDLWGDGSRKCSHCGASDEAGWTSSPSIGAVR